MAQSPTSKSTLVNNAAKDDMVGCDGDLTFTIADLLANDPGGAAKTAAQFFFGSTADDQANQALYMHDHGITDNGDGTFTATAGMDFSYFVQIGNKGTWSKADVDVAHAGQTFFSEGFDSYASPGELEHGYWFAANLSSGGWSSQYGEVVEGEHAPEKLAATSSAADDRGFWLDTQNSPAGSTSATTSTTRLVVMSRSPSISACRRSRRLTARRITLLRMPRWTCCSMAFWWTPFWPATSPKTT
jgi:hypothetical protein